MNKKDAMELIDFAVVISARKTQYFECIKKNKAYSYVENNQEIIKDAIANMDNDIFLTSAEMKSRILETNLKKIKLDVNKTREAFEKELMKQSFGVYVQLF